MGTPHTNDQEKASLTERIPLAMANLDRFSEFKPAHTDYQIHVIRLRAFATVFLNCTGTQLF